MKKLVLLVGVVSLGFNPANAQMPASGESNFSLEGQIGAAFGGGNGLFTAPEIRVRYFLNDNMAIRLGLGVKSAQRTENYAEMLMVLVPQDQLPQNRLCS